MTITTRRFILGCAALVSVALATSAVAAPLNFYNHDTRANGSFADSPFSSTGDGSLQMTTTGLPGDTTNKASVVFRTNPISPLGLLGDLSQLDFNFFLDPSNTVAPDPGAGFAVRLWTTATGFGAGASALVWEGVYQGTNPSETQGAWVSADLDSGLFWQRANGQDFDQIANLKTLAQWETGDAPMGGVALDATTPIYGVEIAFGSGIAGEFNGYVDTLNLAFGATAYQGSFNVPEPGSIALAGLAGLFGTAVYLRRRWA
jgi:hypothetical protein